MRVSSATTSLESHEPISRTGHELGALQSHVWKQIKRYFHKLDRLMTAIAYAEAGNLDAVQKILDENKAMKKLERSAYGNSRMKKQ